VLAFKSTCSSDHDQGIFHAQYFFKNEPKSEDFIFNHYKTLENKTYSLPLNASPFAIIKNKLISVLSIEDHIVYLEASLKGQWHITEVTQDLVNKASLLNENIQCENKRCLKIWNQSLKELTQLTHTNPCIELKSRKRVTSSKEKTENE
jgi:hypothetical protein